MDFSSILFWLLVLLGHSALSCVLFNMVHASAAPKISPVLTRKISEKMIFAFAVIPLVYFAILGIQYGLMFHSELLPVWLKFYTTVAASMGGYFVLRWIYRAITRTLPKGAELVVSTKQDVQSLVEESLYSGSKGRVFAAMPFNQSTQLSVDQWEFSFSQLPARLHGFRICQISDLHLTGVIKQEYFEHVVDTVKQLDPDLVLITGDIVDESKCLDWIGQTLSRLSARRGVYYVLGNHDLLVSDQQDLRRRLNDAGLIMASNSQWHRIEVGDANLMLAGNELPWYRGAEKLPPLDPGIPNSFSVLLSHSPDQIGWAVARNFDLMFAGHTHGGQVRLPIVGPIIAPSRYGIKYAAGTFQARRTLMHVSRGLSGDEPIRINCPPELGIFTLKRETAYRD